MSNVSIWKRFGDWVKGTNRSNAAASEVMHFDAEGGLVGADDKSFRDDEGNPLTVREATYRKLEAIEDGFNRLVDVLGNVNETLHQQRRQSETLQETIKDLPAVMQRIPQAVQSQSALVEKLTEEMRDQNVQYAQLREAIKVLPRQTENQVERLNQITEQLGQSHQTGTQMLENLQAQTMSLANVGELLQKQDERLQKVLAKQQKDFTILFAVAVAISALAIIGVGAYVFLKG